MKIHIQQYKGQTIEYDETLDKFVCDITIEDKFKTTKRQSLKDVRKEIDSFIKNNLGFKPLKLFEKKSYSSEFDVLNVEGIRSDGLFVVRNDRYKDRVFLVDFEKEIRSGDEFFFFDNEIVKEKELIEKEEQEYRKIIVAKERELAKKLKKFDLATINHYTDVFKKQQCQK